MTQDHYTLRPYAPDDAARLATMWNESDDQWPGTFTKGVPMTAERVRSWLDPQKPLQCLIVEDQHDQAIVAYGDLFDQPGEESTAYVSVLNVHPEHQGHSLCRRMLTDMVDWAVEHGYRRMTIDTWPANLKALPLYKKTGFCWTPDTTVFMENYIPAIQRLPAARSFFSQHPWYTTFKRQLDQTEDVQRHPATGKMKVFVYRWEADGDFLEAVIDRVGQAITGLETNDFAAYACVDESEPAQGFAYPVSWRIANKRNEPVEVSLQAKGETGLEIDYQTRFTLAAGVERIIEAQVTCRADAPRLTKNDKEKPAPRILAEIAVGSDRITLGVGLRYHRAIEIKMEPEAPLLLPGQSRTVYLQLHNRLARPVQGQLDITAPPGLTVRSDTLDFQIEARGYSGLPLTVTEADRSLPLSVSATIEDEGKSIRTAPERLPVLVGPLGGVAADSAADKIIIENDLFRLAVEAHGGRVNIRNNRIQEKVFGQVLAELGPPYRPRELRAKRHTLTLEQDLGWAKAVTVVSSSRYPGVRLVRELLVTASPLLQVTYRVENQGQQTYRFQLQNIVHFAHTWLGSYVMPRADGFISFYHSDLGHGDFPKKPEDMAAQWLAHAGEGVVTGVIWPDRLTKHEFGWNRIELNFSEISLEPEQITDVGSFYLYSGPGDWSDVHRIWQRSKNYPDEGPLSLREIHKFDLAADPIISLDNQIATTLHVTNLSQRKINGAMSIAPPADWTSDPVEIPIIGLTKEKSFEQLLTLSAAQPKIGAHQGRLQLKTEVSEVDQPFTLIHLGEGQGRVDVSQPQNQSEESLITLDNGSCQWDIAPHFHGGIVSWRERSEGINHLYSTYPDPGQLGWLKPWFGGIRPLLNLEDEEGWPGKLHEENFKASQVEAPDERGTPWRGVQLNADLESDRLRHFRTEIVYLTVSQSNVLKIIYRLINQTLAYHRVFPGLKGFFQVDGALNNSILHGTGLQRQRTAHMYWRMVEAWGAVVNPDTGRAAVMVAASGPRRVLVMDWGQDGGHLMHDWRVTLKPNDTVEMVTYLALAESLDEAKRYAALAHY